MASFVYFWPFCLGKYRQTLAYFTYFWPFQTHYKFHNKLMSKIEYPSGTRIRTYCLLVTGLLPLSDQGSSHPCKKTVFVANAECNHLQLQSHLSFLFDPTPLRIGYCGVANVHVPQPKGGFHRTVSPTYNRTSR